MDARFASIGPWQRIFARREHEAAPGEGPPGGEERHDEHTGALARGENDGPARMHSGYDLFAAWYYARTDRGYREHHVLTPSRRRPFRSSLS